MWKIVGLKKCINPKAKFTEKRYEFPHKYHRAKFVDGKWIFACNQQDKVQPSTQIEDYGSRLTVHGSEACGSCWRVFVSVSASTEYIY